MLAPRPQGGPLIAWRTTGAVHVAVISADGLCETPGGSWVADPATGTTRSMTRGALLTLRNEIFTRQRYGEFAPSDIPGTDYLAFIYGAPQPNANVPGKLYGMGSKGGTYEYVPPNGVTFRNVTAADDPPWSNDGIPAGES